LLLNSGPIVWLSRKQGLVCTPTTESEYVAAHDITKEIIWIRSLLSDFGFRQLTPTNLYYDNMAALKLIRGEADPRRTKHIDIKYHFVRD
jgi:hypothetical protein